MAILTALLVGVLIPAAGVLAQQGRHDGPSPHGQGDFSRGEPSRGGGDAGRPQSSMSYEQAPQFRGVNPPPSYPPGPAGRANSLGADWRLQQEEARFGVRHGQLAPLGQVIEGIQRRSPGRQLDTGIEYDAGRPVYRVRWMTAHGRRVDFLVDAASGAIMSER